MPVPMLAAAARTRTRNEVLLRAGSGLALGVAHYHHHPPKSPSSSVVKVVLSSPPGAVPTTRHAGTLVASTRSGARSRSGLGTPTLCYKGEHSQYRRFHTTPRRAAESKKVLQTFNLADIGEGITECEVIKWNVKVSSRVQAFDPLCEVQSDKATVEITSPFDGIVKEFLVQEGELAKVGKGLCVIEVDAADATAEDSAPSPSSSPSAVSPASSSAPAAEPTPAPSSPLPTGSSTVPDPASQPQTKRRLHPLDPNNTSKEQKLGSRAGRKQQHQHTGAGAAAIDVLAAPSVRHFAKEQGIADLAGLAPGSGKDGRIEKRDVEAYLQSLSAALQSKVQVEVGQEEEKDVVVELGRTRYNMWKAMVKSLEIPHFGYSTTLDITELHNLLPVLNATIPAQYLPASSDRSQLPLVDPSSIYPAPSPSPVPDHQQYTRLTYLPILLKMLSKAMLQWPLLRSSITPSSSTTPAANDASPSSKPTLTIRPHADINIALSTPTGLYTPTLQSVETHSIYGLSAQLRHLSYLGRQSPCALTPREMPKRGGTVTVSNVGAVGKGEWASPVLVPGGGVAIVALGRAKWVWDVDGDGGGGRVEGERRLKLNVSWSADHRVVEGAELAAFVEAWRVYVENPVRLIGEGV